MGGGESDVAHLRVTTTDKGVSAHYKFTNTDWDEGWASPTTTGTSTYVYSPTVVYKYQIRCPKKGCKTFNWLELNKIEPCTACGARLRAVDDDSDFTISIK